MEDRKEVNKDFEFSETIGKIVKIVLSTGWKFTGKVIDVTESSLIILDRYTQRTTLNKKDIVVCTEVGDGF